MTRSEHTANLELYANRDRDTKRLAAWVEVNRRAAELRRQREAEANTNTTKWWEGWFKW